MSDTIELSNHPCKCIAMISLLVYQILGIIYLVDNYNIDNECINKHIWLYVLISLIATLGHGVTKSADNIPSIIFLFLLINIALTIWGSIEVLDISCLSTRNNHLWIFALITFILQLITSCIFLLIGCSTLSLIVRDSRKRGREEYEEV